MSSMLRPQIGSPTKICCKIQTTSLHLQVTPVVPRGDPTAVLGLAASHPEATLNGS